MALIGVKDMSQQQPKLSAAFFAANIRDILETTIGELNQERGWNLVLTGGRSSDSEARASFGVEIDPDLRWGRYLALTTESIIETPKKPLGATGAEGQKNEYRLRTVVRIAEIAPAAGTQNVLSVHTVSTPKGQAEFRRELATRALACFGRKLVA